MGCVSSSEAKDTRKPANQGVGQPDAPEITSQTQQNQVVQATNGALSQPPELPLRDVNTPLYVARFAYTARTAEDLSFEKGERLKLICGTDGDWWMAKSVKTGKEGYVPRNYIADLTSFEAEE